MQESAILLLNKDRGISSNTAANKVKYLLGANKAGHLGTLDVLGEGLLPITLNKATKLFDYFLGKNKEYETIFKFGQTSPTLDLEGPLSNEDSTLDLSTEDVIKILPLFIGKHQQMPPQYSAKKVNGQKAYNLARKGQDVSLKPKLIEIYKLDLINKIEKNTFQFRVSCSSGTFIRSLCRDMASKLSTCGVMQRIIRTKCGKFNLEDAFTIQDIENGNYKLINTDVIFDEKRLDINEVQYKNLCNGVMISCLKGDYKVYYKNQFLGIGHANEENKLKLSLRLF